MRHKITEKIEIPEGISCTFNENVLTCKKESNVLERKIEIPQVKIILKGKEIIFECEKANKNIRKTIMSFLAHVKNMFYGLDEKFTYVLEAANVHFPMSFKVEKNNLIINNFLGEKVPRKAAIMPNVEVEIKGQKIIVTSSNIEAAGQTAGNFEKATRVKGRDRRIYQDGLYIVEKPSRKQK